MEEKERGTLVQKKWSNNFILLVFCTSLHTLINKYVLSVLQFQYPTLFISWQCGICMFLLMSAHSIGYIKLSSIDRGAIKLWLPCMVLHTAVMYFGSVSLSKLAVPIFIGLQNLTYLFMEFCNLWRSKLLPSLSVQVSLVMIGFGAFYLFYTNLNTNSIAYNWVSLYIICSGLYAVLAEIIKDTKLSGLDRIFCNSFFCITSLTVLSIATREWIHFFEFPFRHHGRFIIGCWFSGILHFLASVLPYFLTREKSSDVCETGIAAGRVLVSLVSLGLFEGTLDESSVLSVLMLHGGGMVYTYSKYLQKSQEK